jgi:uncharacterized protein (TIGR03435 family)
MISDRAIVAVGGFIAMAIGVAGVFAQSPAPRPEFDAATIRLNVDGGPYVFNGMKSLGTFASENQTLRNLVQEAYGVPSGRRNWLPFFAAAGQGVPILGGPAWIGNDRWDITAKWNAAPPDGHLTMTVVEEAQAEMELMLRALLEQRFQLKLHRETRDLPVYELTVAHPGKLKQAKCVVFDPENVPAAVPGQAAPDYCGASREGRRGLDWTLDGAGMKMGGLARALSQLIGSRIIVDKTGYAGTFDAHLRWTPGEGETGAGNVPASPDDANESIFTVLQEQLGLRLKAGRGPVEVIVIDRAERPTAN